MRHSGRSMDLETALSIYKNRCLLISLAYMPKIPLSTLTNICSLNADQLTVKDLSVEAIQVWD